MKNMTLFLRELFFEHYLSLNFGAEKQTFYAVKQKQFTPNVGHELFYETICFYDDWRGAV